MAMIHTAVRIVSGQAPNKTLHDLTDDFRELDNAEFFAEVAKRIAAMGAGPGDTSVNAAAGVACIGLIGTYGYEGYALRRAQEPMRLDRTPSHWSHAFLFAEPVVPDAAVLRDASRAPWVWESTLTPPAAFAQFAQRAGVSPRRLSDYAMAAYDLYTTYCVPNVAVVGIGVSAVERQQMMEKADHPAVERFRYDLRSLQSLWHRYLASPTTRRNPIAAGHALHSAAYVQLAYDAAGIDLAPGAAQRNVTPEHMWQAVKYLNETWQMTAGAQTVPRQVVGWYCVRDAAGVLWPETMEMPVTLSDLTSIEEIVAADAPADAPPADAALADDAPVRARRKRKRKL